MNRRGIALLGALWLVATLSVVAAVTLARAQVERGAAVNRVAMVRGRWAADACLALADAARREEPVLEDVDSTDLGGGLWCRATMEDLGAKVGLEIANAAALSQLVGDPERAAALLDWLDPDGAPRALGAEEEWYRVSGIPGPRNGPMASIEELHRVRGFDTTVVARLARFVTPWPARRLNVNAAPVELLRTLSGLDPAAAEMIAERRRYGGTWEDLDGMLSTLPANLRAHAMTRYAELAAATTFAPGMVLLHLEGHVPGAPIVARSTVLAVITPGRLAILTREEW